MFNPEDYGHEWVDVTTGLLAPQKWLAVSISIDGKYQTAIEELGDIYISSNFGQSWTISTNIGREVSNSVAFSTVDNIKPQAMVKASIFPALWQHMDKRIFIWSS